MKRRIFLVESQLCIGCGKCELACAFGHALMGRPGKSRISIFRLGDEKGVPIVCLQCHDPACASVCPTNALRRNKDTLAIELVPSLCIRCKMCISACPFGNMHFDDVFDLPAKCDLCGGEPKCVPFCPTGCLKWVSEEKVLALSKDA